MRRLSLLIGAFLVAASQAAAQPPPPSYELKAAFLYNFLRYVEWPMRPATGPLFLCVVEVERVGRALQATVKGEKIDGRSVETMVIQQPTPECHLVFAPSSVDPGAYIRAARGQLTVGESPTFLQQGGIINFRSVGGKLRFEIDTEAAQRADVRISSRLLRLRYTRDPGGTR